MANAIALDNTECAVLILGGSKWASITFFVSGPKFTIFSSTVEGIVLITPFFACRSLDLFQRYLLSKSRVVHCWLWSGQNEQLSFLAVDQSSSIFFSLDVGGVVVDHLVFWLSMSQSFPNIFTIKVQSCRKLRQNLDVFAPNFFLRCSPQKLYPNSYTCYAAHYLEQFREVTPLAWKILVLIRWILGFFWIFIVKNCWGTPISGGVCVVIIYHM